MVLGLAGSVATTHLLRGFLFGIQPLDPLTIGAVIGVAAALMLTRVMRSMLVGVGATDPATFVAIAVLFFAIAALACWLPARRAAGLDPKIALREE
jgi:ABC-type lipoprotein release transport system permease subunit